MVVASKSLSRTASRPSARGRLERALLHAERRLVDPETAFTPELLEQTLHPDYVETGSTGNVYSREKNMEMMLNRRPRWGGDSATSVPIRWLKTSPLSHIDPSEPAVRRRDAPPSGFATASRGGFDITRELAFPTVGATSAESN